MTPTETPGPPTAFSSFLFLSSVVLLLLPVSFYPILFITAVPFLQLNFASFLPSFSFFPPSLLSFLPLFLPCLLFLSFFKILLLSSLFLFLFSGFLSLGLCLLCLSVSFSLFFTYIQRIHSISRTVHMKPSLPPSVPACVVSNKHHSSSKDRSYTHVWQTPVLVLLEAACLTLLHLSCLVNFQFLPI